MKINFTKKQVLKSITIFSMFLSIIFAANTVGPFTYTPTNTFGLMYGQATINNISAETGDVIAAFDASGNCAGAIELNIQPGAAYIVLQIYGDDATTPGTDEGMNSGEDFFLKLWDSSENQIIDYGSGFSGWQNTNGMPIPGYNDPSVVYNFVVAVDQPPTVANAISDVTVDEDASNSTIDLTSVFTDSDNDDSAITKSVQTNSNSTLVTASISGNTLTLDYQENQSGTATITIRGTSNGKTVDDVFEITVNAVNDAPTGGDDNVATNEDVVYTFQTSDFTFSDIEGNSFDGIKIISVESAGDLDYDGTDVTSNTDYIDVTKLVFTPTQNENGNPYATFTFKVKDDDGAFSSSTYTMTININAVDDAPTVSSAIGDVIVDENAVDSEIDITNVFTDIDNDDSAITKTVQTNTNSTLVTASISGTTLTLNYQDNQSGTATITIRGTSNGKTVDDVFEVTVNDVNNPPTVANAIDDVTVDEDAGNSTIDLTNVFTDPDNDDAAIVKTVQSNSNSGLVSTSISGHTLTLDYLANQNGSATITIRGTSNGQTVDDEFEVTVNPINDAPIGGDDDVTTNEDVNYTFQTIDFTYSDIESDAFGGIEIITIETTGDLEYNGNDVSASESCPDVSQLVFKPVAGENGSPYATFTFKVKDANGAASTLAYTMTINVAEVNDPPTVDNPIADVTVDEDAGNSTIDLTNVFTDPDNDDAAIVKTVQANSNSALVTATISGNTLTLDYQNNQFGTATITIRGTSNGQTVDDEFTVTVNAVNDAPTGGNDVVSTNEDVNYTFQTSDFTYSDIESDAFNGIEIITTETAGDIEYNGSDVSASESCPDVSQLVFKPVAGENGSPYATFTFKVKDANGAASATAYTMTINVVEVNDPPTVANEISDFTVDEDASDTEIDLANVFTDPDNDDASIVKTVQANSNSGLVSASISGNTLTLDYQDNQFGTATITIRGTSNGQTVDDDITVTVNAVNDAPTGGNDVVSTNEDVNYTFQTSNFTYADIESDAFNGIEIITIETAGDLEYNGSDVSASESCPDVSQLVFIPVAEENGSPYATFTFKVKDANGAISASAYTMTINVTEVNDPPIVANPIADVTVDEDAADTEIDLTNVFADPDNDDAAIVKAVQANSNSALVTATISGNTLTLDYQNNQFGTATITIRGTSNGQTVDDEFTITVNAVNDAPTGGNDVVSTNEDVNYTFQTSDFTYSDIESDAFGGIEIITIETAGDLEYNGSDVSASENCPDVSQLVFKPVAGENGSPYATFTFKVKDANGAVSASNYTMTINVYEENDPPVIANPIADVTVDEDATNSEIDLTNVFTDQDNDDADIVKIVHSNNNTGLVSASISGNTLTLDFLDDQNGSATITIRGTSNGQTVDDEFTITVNAVNDAPTGGDDAVSTNEDVNYTFQTSDFTYSDIESDAFGGIEIITIETAGDLEYNGSDVSANESCPDVSQLVFKPVAGENGSPYATFTFKVKDANGAVSISNYTMTINVYEENDPPVIANPIADVTVDEDATNSEIDLTNVFTDQDNDDADIVKIVHSNNNTGLVSASISGNTLTLDFLDDQNGSATITIRGTSNGQTVDDEFTITVNAVDDAPIVLNPIADIGVQEDADTTNIDLTNVFVDIDNDNASITKSVKTNTNESLVIITISGNILTLDYQDGQSGTAIITISGTSNGKTVDDEFVVSVGAIDDPPVVANSIANVEVDEDAVNSEIDLTNVFTDSDNDDATITKTVEANSNPELVTVTINGNALTLDYLNDQNGTATITIRGTSNGQTIDDEFVITVNAVNDMPSSDNSVVTSMEDEILIFSKENFIFNDIEDDSISGIIITNSVDKGILNYNGEDVTLNTVYSDISLLTFTPVEDENASPYTTFVFKVVDSGNLNSSEYTMTINVLPDANNQDPIVNNAINDTTIYEDSDELVIDINNTFTDPDDNDTKINVSLFSNSNESLCSASIENRVVKITLENNQYGTSSIIIRAESNGGTVDEEFLIIVLPVNDNPENFALVSPENNDIITIDSLMSESSIDFIWNKAIDPDWEDTLTYSIIFFNEQDTLFAAENIQDTIVSFPCANIIYQMSQLGINELTGQWMVLCDDGEFNSYSEENYILTIKKEVTAIDDVEICKEFNLYQNYPNPFNPTTNIKFDLSANEHVIIGIYNLNGELLELLANRTFSSGSNLIKWNAAKYSSGIYLYKIETSTNMEIKKCMLIK